MCPILSTCRLVQRRVRQEAQHGSLTDPAPSGQNALLPSSPVLGTETLE